MEDRRKVHFSDLDGGLKTAIVVLWIMIGLWGLSFLVAFIIAMLQAA